MGNNNTKKYYHDHLPVEEKTDADPETKQFAKGVIDAFESGKILDDVIQGNHLNNEKDAAAVYNTQHRNNDQAEFWGNINHNTLMAQFPNRNGDIKKEIISSPTPLQVTDRTGYSDAFVHIFGYALFDVTQVMSSPSSFSTPSTTESDKPADSRKRTRDDDSDGNDQGPSKRAKTSDYADLDSADYDPFDIF